MHIQHKGLSPMEVKESRERYGSNDLTEAGRSGIFQRFLDIVIEPMFLLLLVATIVYFILGERDEGIMMLVAILIVSLTSFYQQAKSENALKLLKDLSAPHVSVIRDGNVQEVKVNEVVTGDLMIVTEGELISADGILVKANDLSVDESLLTGESFAVVKTVAENANTNTVFRGTSVVSGSGIAEVTATGNRTGIGKLGKSISDIPKEKTPLQKQVSTFVKYMAMAGAIAFVVIWAFSYYRTGVFFDSLLSGLTIIMSVLPEEIPVALSVFMALAAWRMTRERILAKEPQTVEALGAATVICVDKTGTITENKMKLNSVYSYSNNEIRKENFNDRESLEVISYAMWSSEPSPFDAMEVAIHESYKASVGQDERMHFKMIAEYPLEGKPPMMTHIYENNKNEKIIACKGAPETILSVTSLPDAEKEKIEKMLKVLASEGLRLLGVAKAEHSGQEFPKAQHDFNWKFLGLIGLYDPPRKNIRAVIKEFNEAGIEVKMITGDYAETAVNIASQIGMTHCNEVLTGKDVLNMSEMDLRKHVQSCSIFARILPEGKLRIVKALKANGEVVAMTGDGVNDGPALKAADIGVAMGKLGTEIARRSASIILLDDDLSKMITAISFGRKTYVNLKKAIQYIISIHIPIIGIVMFPLLLGWKFSSVFEPVHIIFLELVMGPTCSIVFEREPMEENLMRKKPRKITSTFISWKELRICLMQGLIILAGLLFVLHHSISLGHSAAAARTLVFITLIFSNVFLTLTNRSREYTLVKTLGYKNNLVPLILGITLLILVLTLTVPFLQNIFRFEPVSFSGIILPLVVSGIAVFWFEIYKGLQFRNKPDA